MGSENISTTSGDRSHDDADSPENPAAETCLFNAAPEEDDNDTLMAYADDEYEEDEDIQSGYGEEEEEEDDDDDDNMGDSHSGPDVPQVPHQQDLDLPDAYPSDMSDDEGGAPLAVDDPDHLANDPDVSDFVSPEAFMATFPAENLPSIQNFLHHISQPTILPMPVADFPYLSQYLSYHDNAAAAADPTPAPAPPAVPMGALQVLQVQQLGAPSAEDEEDDDNDMMFLGAPGAHPMALSNPNPNTLGPGNPGLVDFLRHWARDGAMLKSRDRDRPFPWINKINDLSATRRTDVLYTDLAGDQCDFQGIDWEDLGVTREEARLQRRNSYANYVNLVGSDIWNDHLPDLMLPPTESYFRFHRMDIRHDTHLSHFQLRNLLASTSRTNAFYTGNGVVHCLNPVSGKAETVMRLGNVPASQVSALAADHNVLIAGGFAGEYVLRRLDSYEADDERSRVYADCHEGTITSNISGITNHVQIHQARQSSSPRAAFASNDMCFRVLDINTQTFVSEERFNFPLNCSALSPDRRLRVMVGDHKNVLITAAESGYGNTGRPEIIHRLSGHRDHGFACDWADDGWTIATGFQDRSIKIWDARWFTDSNGVGTPVETIRTEMAGARSVRFSPIGSGKRVLVAAEEADFINIIDGATFREKQTIDVFGEIGGVTFSNGGQDLMALCCDRVRGGILQFQRCRLGGEVGYLRRSRSRSQTYDWPQSPFTEEKRVHESATRRRRKGVFLDAIEPF